jgi:hypothetical protein
MPLRGLAPAFLLTLGLCACSHGAPPPSTSPTFAASMHAAATTSPSQLTWKTDRVVIFKDSYGLLAKSGSGTADAQGDAFTDDVPDAAVLGCFWAIAEDDSMLAMSAEWVETTERRQRRTAALSVADLLRANAGKNVTLELGNNNNNTRIDGRIERVLDVPQEVAPLSTEGDSTTAEDVVGTTTFPLLIRGGDPLRVPVSGAFTPDAIPGGAGTLLREITPRGGNWVVIVQNDRKMVLPVRSVESVTGGDVVTDVTREREVFTRSKRLHFNFGSKHANQKVTLRLFYFTPGLRWIPTYRVAGDLVDKANLSLQGEVLNEVGDIDHAAVDLVVGVPNFRFADTLSPLTLETALRATLQPTINLANNGNMLQSQFRGDNRFRGGQYGGQAVGGGGGGAGGGGEGGGAPGDLAMAPELAGSGGEQDLFVYNLGDFSLKKGSRATAPLWRETAPLRHIYTYDIRARRNRAGGGTLTDDPLAAPGAPGMEQQQDSRTPNRIVLNQVWHQLELTNAGAVPWTTGAALLLRGNLPLGQDLLVYTPPNGKARLPVTVAVDIRGSADEQEAGRTANALRFDNDDWSEVRKTGTVTVTSFRKEKSAMCVTLSTGGKVAKASDNAKIKLNDFRAGDWDDQGNMRVNNHSDVTWEFELEPGKTKTLTYEVSFYTR